jgi:hypothetical protein
MNARVAAMQRVRSEKQVEAFYHDNFVEEQVDDFVRLLGMDSSERRRMVAGSRYTASVNCTDLCRVP